MVEAGRVQSVPHIVLEGPMRVGRCDGSTALVPPSLQPLVALLCLAPESKLTRETVLAELWPDVDPAKARARLSTGLWRLRSLLHPEAGDRSEAADDGDDTLGRGDELLRALADCAGAREWKLLRSIDMAGIDWSDPASAPLRHRLERVAVLDPRDLVAGCTHEWVEQERARLQMASQRVLTHLVEANDRLDEVDRAIVLAELLVERDELREDGHRWLMRLQARAGRRIEALRRYDECREILVRELGVEPSTETSELANSIRNLLDDPAPHRSPALPSPTASLGFSMALGDDTESILAALDRARAALAQVEAALRLNGIAIDGPAMADPTVPSEAAPEIVTA